MVFHLAEIALGPGSLESVYEKALFLGLTERTLQPSVFWLIGVHLRQNRLSLCFQVPGLARCGDRAPQGRPADSLFQLEAPDGNPLSAQRITALDRRPVADQAYDDCMLMRSDGKRLRISCTVVAIGGGAILWSVAIVRETRNGVRPISGAKKLGDGHGLRRPAFVLRPSRRALRAAPGLRNDWTPCRMAWHFVSAGAHAPHSDETHDPTPTRESSHSARRLRSLAFLCSSVAAQPQAAKCGPRLACLPGQSYGPPTGCWWTRPPTRFVEPRSWFGSSWILLGSWMQPTQP